MNDFSSDDDYLYTIVSQTNEIDKLDKHLKNHLNVEDVLMYLYRRDDQSISLLMLAVLHGKDEMVRVILSYSKDLTKIVELHGIVHRMNGMLVRNVTALWCACDRQYYSIARMLIEIGEAKVDHGPRYPLIIDAIIVGRLDTVRFLIENNYANINNTEMNENYKLNSLIMAVIYSHANIVSFLLEKGAKFNYTTPSSSNTPLGYAAIKGHLEIVRLLCAAGACSSMINKHGQTPLMLAAKYDRMSVVDYLLEQNDIEIGLKQLELIACSFILTMNMNWTIQASQYQRMSNLLRKVFEIRQAKNLLKIVAQPIAAYAFQQECQTLDEFEKIQTNHERLYVEALLIRERLLVPEKTENLFKPLLIYGDKLVERGQYELCLHLWEHTFYLYQNMDFETGLHRFVWVFSKMLAKQIPILPQRFVQIARLTFEPSQQKPRDDYIKNAVCFLAIALKLLEQSTLTLPERQLIHQWIKDFCRQKRLTSLGQTLLHLVVDRQTYHDINYRAYDIKPILIFPNLSVAQFLLTHCTHWIDIDATDTSTGSTALHISCQSDSLSVTEYLINSGAHIDSLNMYKQTPFDLARTKEIQTLFKTKQAIPRLKCQCARIIHENQFAYESIWPRGTEMNKFLFLHGSLVKDSTTTLSSLEEFMTDEID